MIVAAKFDPPAGADRRNMVWCSVIEGHSKAHQGEMRRHGFATVPSTNHCVTRLDHESDSLKRGSSTSRRPSPSRFTAKTNTKIAMPGRVETHHALSK